MSYDSFDALFRQAAGLADTKDKEAIKALRKMLQQAVNGEKKWKTRAETAEASLETMKKRAQNNIDRAYNQGIRDSGGDTNIKRIIRHPEFGTSLPEQKK